MPAHSAVDLVREALFTALAILSPVLVVAIVVGLVVGLMQALTQIQDHTIGFAVKLVAVGVALVFCLPWLIGRMIEYAQIVITNIPATIAGG